MSHGFAVEEKDHGNLDGLSDDDHTQYLNDTRHNTAHGVGKWRRGSSNQTISGATTCIFNELVREDDADGDIDMNLSTGVWTINNAGWYMMVVSLNMGTGTSGNSQIQIRQDPAGTPVTLAGIEAEFNINIEDITFMGYVDAGETFDLHIDPANHANFQNDPKMSISIMKVRE